MEELFRRTDVEDIEDNVFKLIGKDWMLITAGRKDHYNMMTASWGTAGYLWKKPIMITFVRPQRYTYEFIEQNAHFSVSFFEEKDREVLNLCGTTSGRDLNKMDIDGLTPMETPAGTIAFREAKMIVECRKLYYDDIKPDFFQAFSIEAIYPQKDYHRFYIGEVLDVWMKK